MSPQFTPFSLLQSSSGKRRPLPAKQPDYIEMPGVSKIDTDQTTPVSIDNLRAQENVLKLGERDTRSRSGLLLEQLRHLIPGYEDIIGGATRGVKDMLGGLIPKDVVDRTVKSMAAAGISTGTGAMSDFIKNRTAAHLGATSMDLFSAGIEKAKGVVDIASAGIATPMETWRQYGTPELRAGIQQQNVENEYTARLNDAQTRNAQMYDRYRLQLEGQALSGMGGIAPDPNARSALQEGLASRYAGSGLAGRATRNAVSFSNFGGGGGFVNTVNTPSQPYQPYQPYDWGSVPTSNTYGAGMNAPENQPWALRTLLERGMNAPANQPPTMPRDWHSILPTMPRDWQGTPPTGNIYA